MPDTAASRKRQISRAAAPGNSIFGFASARRFRRQSHGVAQASATAAGGGGRNSFCARKQRTSDDSDGAMEPQIGHEAGAVAPLYIRVWCPGGLAHGLLHNDVDSAARTHFIVRDSQICCADSPNTLREAGKTPPPTASRRDRRPNLVVSKTLNKTNSWSESSITAECYLCNTRLKTRARQRFQAVPLLRVHVRSVIVFVRRRGASRGRPVLGGSLKSTCATRID